MEERDFRCADCDDGAIKRGFNVCGYESSWVEIGLIGKKVHWVSKNLSIRDVAVMHLTYTHSIPYRKRMKISCT